MPIDSTDSTAESQTVSQPDSFQPNSSYSEDDDEEEFEYIDGEEQEQQLEGDGDEDGDETSSSSDDDDEEDEEVEVEEEEQEAARRQREAEEAGAAKRKAEEEAEAVRRKAEAEKRRKDSPPEGESLSVYMERLIKELYDGKTPLEGREREKKEAELKDAFFRMVDYGTKKHFKKVEPLYVKDPDPFNFPKDPEKWREIDLMEKWGDAPATCMDPGWDPNSPSYNDYKAIEHEIREGNNPPLAPFYVPYRKYNPAIDDNNIDIKEPKLVIEELDRIEEFLHWMSFIFEDKSSYEGTVWDDMAHGKGVYISGDKMLRYEGEWFQNIMEGHGVIEIDIPDVEPVPGSEMEERMRREGKIIPRDFMYPEDKKWLEMDMEDVAELEPKDIEIPFYKSPAWPKSFGDYPERGRYRYAGQWKHGKMHGCGLYEVNESVLHGRFYFGEYLGDKSGCDEDSTALHAGIAEVAAAKARMFVNKPDGMLREKWGPYTDAQHPYMYDTDDVWMAPGFAHQFQEVPDYWKSYVQEVDQEREMWLNSFYKAPLRLPMTSELEYLWSQDEEPEFVLINKEPEPDPEDPSSLIHTDDPLILHTPTGQIINYVEDEEHGLRLFLQPSLKDGEKVDPDKAKFLPLGYDEFFEEEESAKEENIEAADMGNQAADNQKIEEVADAKKKAAEMRLELVKKELELIEMELSLEEAIEDLEEVLNLKEKEVEKVETGSVLAKQDQKFSADKEEGQEEEEEKDEDEEEEEEEDVEPSSFGSVSAAEDPKDDDQGKTPKDSPFSASSLSFASCSVISLVPSKLQKSFLSWKECRLPRKDPDVLLEKADSITFSAVIGKKCCMRAVKQAPQKFQARTRSHGRASQLHSLARILWRSSASVNSEKEAKQRSHCWLEGDIESILSLHIPMHYLESSLSQ